MSSIMYLIIRAYEHALINFVGKFHEQGVHCFRVFVHCLSIFDISIELLFFQRHALLIEFKLRFLISIFCNMILLCLSMDFCSKLVIPEPPPVPPPVPSAETHAFFFLLPYPHYSTSSSLGFIPKEARWIISAAAISFFLLDAAFCLLLSLFPRMTCTFHAFL
jgi:hypothetical protein